MSESRDRLMKLRDLKVPEPREASITTARDSALKSYRNAEPRSAAGSAGWRAALGFSALGAAAACCFMLVVNQPTESAWVAAVRESQQVLNESLALFPDELSAIVSKGAETTLIMQSHGALSKAQPVIVEFSRGTQQLRVTTFSGEKLALDLAGEKLTVEVFVSGAGEIFIAGEDYVWSEKSQVTLRGFTVRAAHLRANFGVGA